MHVEPHPDKTFIGRVSRGFDFLGYAFKPAGLDAAPPTIERCAQRVSRLYEQGVDLVHIGTYVRRWLRWTRSGLGALGAGLAERALERVRLPLTRVGLPDWASASLRPAMAGPGVNDADPRGPDCRENGR